MHMLDKMGHLADGSVEIHPSLNAVPQFAGNRKLPGRSGLGIKDMDLLARDDDSLDIGHWLAAMKASKSVPKSACPPPEAFAQKSKRPYRAAGLFKQPDLPVNSGHDRAQGHC